MDRVVVTVKSGEQYEYDGAYSAEELKQICKDGDEVVFTFIGMMRQFLKVLC